VVGRKVDEDGEVGREASLGNRDLAVDELVVLGGLAQLGRVLREDPVINFVVRVVESVPNRKLDRLGIRLDALLRTLPTTLATPRGRLCETGGEKVLEVGRRCFEDVNARPEMRALSIARGREDEFEVVRSLRKAELCGQIGKLALVQLMDASSRAGVLAILLANSVASTVGKAGGVVSGYA
jgi:hypothetical protein